MFDPTGGAIFLSVPPGEGIPVMASPTASAEGRALSFLASHGEPFFISDKSSPVPATRSAAAWPSRVTASGYTASQYDLSSLAGQNVRFGFRLGTDSSVDDAGWAIDDVRLYTCAAPSDLIFENGFDASNLAAWPPSRSGTISRRQTMSGLDLDVGRR